MTGLPEMPRERRMLNFGRHKKLMAEYEWADKIVSVSPSYWADIPWQFKGFIDRCTPWCNTHEPHAKISGGKKGYTIALRTGASMPECEKIIGSIEHFYGHLEIEASGNRRLERARRMSVSEVWNARPEQCEGNAQPIISVQSGLVALITTFFL